MNKEDKLMEQYLLQRNFRKAKGYAITTQEMNPEDYEEIFFEGNSLQDAIEGHYRKVDYWIYEPSDGEQVFEDIGDAIEYAEDNFDVSFEEFVKGGKK